MRWSVEEMRLLLRRREALAVSYPAALLTLYKDGTHDCDASIVVQDLRRGDQVVEVYVKTAEGVEQLSPSGEVLAKAPTLAEMFGC